MNALLPAQANMVQMNPNLDANNLQYRQVADLRQHYLDKHKYTIGPWKGMTAGIVLIVAVAIGVFSNLAALPAALLSIGAIAIILGVADLILRSYLKLHINNQAADAVLTPGFYEFARQNPRNFGSAEALVQAHRQFVGG